MKFSTDFTNMTQEQEKQQREFNKKHMIKKVWRIVPDDGLPMALHPPGTHKASPIINDYILLTYGHNPFSSKRHGKHMPKQQGVYDGFIGSDLRMHVLINARDEVLNKWEVSEGRPHRSHNAAHALRHGCKS